MAKNIGLIKISGKVGDLQFFKKDGKAYVGLSSNISKDRIKKDPAFKRTRENMAEFGGAASVSKHIRESLVPISSLIEKGLHSRFTSILRELINYGTGNRGRRKIEFSQNADMITGFELNAKTKVSEVVHVPIDVVSNTDRNQLIMTLPEFLPSDYLLIPEGATHFKIHLAGLALSDFGPMLITNKYKALNDAQNGIFDSVASVELPVDALVTGGLTLQVDLPGAPVLAPEVSLVAMVGIEFMQIVNNDYYLFASNNAIRIEKLF